MVIWPIFLSATCDEPRSDDAEGVGTDRSWRTDAGTRILQEGPKAHREIYVAIYRTLFYGDVTVGTGGRMTIPLTMRESCGFREGDTLTVRVEENPRGVRQLVMWRANPHPDD